MEWRGQTHPDEFMRANGNKLENELRWNIGFPCLDLYDLRTRRPTNVAIESKWNI